MTCMRNPTHDEKIQAQSIAEIKDALDRERRRLARLKDKVRFRRRVVSAGTLLNAVILNFLEMPQAEREEIARRGLASYEARLQSDDPTEIDLGITTDPPKKQAGKKRKDPIAPPGSSAEVSLRDGKAHRHGKKAKGSNVPKA